MHVVAGRRPDSAIDANRYWVIVEAPHQTSSALHPS